MYDLLFSFSQRPTPFSRDTVKELWTRPHLARQMLDLHISQESDAASWRLERIDQVVERLDAQLDLSGKHVCDLGCGPGLYTERFASVGATVTGVDFSSYSVSFAKSHSTHKVQYIEADYLLDDLPTGFDLVTLIYTDYCSLSPQQRGKLLHRIRGMLKPGGYIALDVVGIGSFAAKEEVTLIENRLMNGFWAPGEYVGLKRTFLYKEDRLSLDHYVIVQPNETWKIFNWVQHFTPQSIDKELRDAGFKIDHLAGDLIGTPLEPEAPLIGVVARRD